MKKLLLGLAAYLFAFTSMAQDPIATITVQAGKTDRVNTPVSVSIKNLPYHDAENWEVVEVKKGNAVPVPSQIEKGYHPQIWWVLTGETPAGTSRTFQIRPTDAPAQPKVTVSKDEQSLLVSVDGKNALQYVHALTPPPPGKDPKYVRSGYIHPLWSPSGFPLTRIHPEDHIHHMGIWAPWTKTTFEGKEVDFWNLAKGDGTVRFAEFAGMIEGAVYGGFQAVQNHVALNTEGGEKVAMNELLDVRVMPAGENAWVVDYTSTFNCASDSPIMLEEYRYGGGLGFRATELWTHANSRFLTSEGNTRENGDATRAKWCDVNGVTDSEGKAGILFMCHPSNQEFPQPMRIWPVEMKADKGDVFFEFCPIRHQEWPLTPGNDYVLTYRMFVYDGEIGAEEAERLWQDFANPPAITME